MRRSILTSICIAAGIFALPARVLAVWPPSTSLVVESDVSSTGPHGEKLPPTLHRDARTVTSRLEQDERRLEQVIQDLKEDEAELKKLSQKN